MYIATAETTRHKGQYTTTPGISHSSFIISSKNTSVSSESHLSAQKKKKNQSASSQHTTATAGYTQKGTPHQTLQGECEVMGLHIYCTTAIFKGINITEFWVNP